MHRNQAVIAKYKEKVDWLQSLAKDFELLVYDKGDPKAPLSLPNIPLFDREAFRGCYHANTPTGRESHTYLCHILKNYEHLAPWTLFIQARVGDHIFHFEQVLQEVMKLNPCPHFFHFGNTLLCDREGGPGQRGLPLERVFKRLFDAPCPDYFFFQISSCFLVSRERLLMRPKSFYEQMMQIVYEEPLSGYIYERLWGIILNTPDIPSRPHYAPVNRNLWQLEAFGL